jgi:hypothetical protein
MSMLPMKRLILLLLGSMLALRATGQVAVRTLEPTALAGHRAVAILPFEVTQARFRARDLRYLGTDTTAATRKRVQQEWTAQQQQEIRVTAYQLQALLYAQLLAQAPTQGYTVVFQPANETNRLLQQAGISYENLPDQTMPALQRALGVDAILSGQTMLFQPLPKGVGIAARILLDEAIIPGNNPTVPRSEATTNLTLHDCATGKLAWRLDLLRRGDAALKPERLTKDLVRAALPAFPYKRR